LVGG
jgi:hypothetical protein